MPIKEKVRIALEELEQAIKDYEDTIGRDLDASERLAFEMGFHRGKEKGRMSK